MGGHALRGAMVAWLGLIALQAVGTAGGSGRLAELFAAANQLVHRALDPTVPAIPDLAHGESWGQTGASASTYQRPADLPLNAPTGTPRLPIPGRPVPQ